jgi:hypothetical protein
MSVLKMEQKKNVYSGNAEYTFLILVAGTGLEPATFGL